MDALTAIKHSSNVLTLQNIYPPCTPTGINLEGGQTVMEVVQARLGINKSRKTSS